MAGRGLRIGLGKAAAAAVLLTLVVPVAPAVAHAKSATSCKSADLRYPFMPGGPKSFGVFSLRISDGTCATAHRVAKAWMQRFEANVQAGQVKLPHTVAGFTFKTLPANAAQTYREQGRKDATTIRFDYRVPNG